MDIEDKKLVVETNNEHEWLVVQRIEHTKRKLWNGGDKIIPFNEDEPCINVGLHNNLFHCDAELYIEERYKILSYDEYINKNIDDGSITKEWLLQLTLDNKVA